VKVPYKSADPEGCIFFDVMPREPDSQFLPPADFGKINSQFMERS